MVIINPNAPTVALSKYYNKKLNLKVLDNRGTPNFIGFRNPINMWAFEEKHKNPNYFNQSLQSESTIPALNNNQDLALIIRDKLSTNLNQRGLKLKRFTPNQITVELLELSVIPTKFRTEAYSKIRVTAVNKAGNQEEIYEKKIIRSTPIFGSTNNEYYNRIINDCLDQNIQSVISDNKLWNFLD